MSTVDRISPPTSAIPADAGSGSTHSSTATYSGPFDMARARRQRRAALIGNVFEFYDFMVYAFLAATLARKFFYGSEMAALLSSFAAFGVGFLARPLGGALIGRFADTHGRRSAMLLTVVGMAIGTVGIGLLPTYASIGLAAPILLVVLRLIQGLAAGGEWGTSAAFIVESAPPDRRGFFGSFGQSSVALAILVSNLIVLAVNSSFTAAQMDAWAWRVPFLLGALLVPVGFYMRRNMEETPAYERTHAAPETDAALATNEGPILMMGRAFGFTILWTVAFYVILAYMPTFLAKYAGLSGSGALLSNSVALLVIVIAVPCFGRLSDRIGRKPLLLASCLGFVVLGYPLFHILLNHGTWVTILAAQIVMNLLISMFSGAGPAAICEMFPTRSRTALMSFSYSLSTALFGGFAPFVATWLIAKTGSPIAPTLYLIGSAIVTALVVFRMKETAHRRLR